MRRSDPVMTTPSVTLPEDHRKAELLLGQKVFLVRQRLGQDAQVTGRTSKKRAPFPWSVTGR
jgi:hypothetical protein